MYVQDCTMKSVYFGFYSNLYKRGYLKIMGDHGAVAILMWYTGYVVTYKKIFWIKNLRRKEKEKKGKETHKMRKNISPLLSENYGHPFIPLS